MKNTLAKPTFREVVAVTTMELPDVGLIFNSQIVGPMSFNGLRNADYGKGFRMSTMPELTGLVYASLENQDYQIAKEVISTLKKYWIAGNTGVHYTKKGMWVQDNPNMENGRILMKETELEKMLGTHEENGVVFSDDKTIRFTPYNYKTKSQSSLSLAKNPGVIALSGGEENAEKLAKASEHYRLNPYFWALLNVDLPQTRVAGLGSGDFDDRLDVDASGSEYGGNRCSFGVLDKDTAGVAQKNK